MVIDLTSTSSQSMAREKVSAQRTAGATSSSNAAPATKAASSQDTFELSKTAKALANADAIIADSPDVNSDKVADIKAALADGSYKIDYQSVARSMLSFERQIS